MKISENINQIRARDEWKDVIHRDRWSYVELKQKEIIYYFLYIGYIEICDW